MNEQNSEFYQEWIVDNNGKYSVMFDCHDLISAVIHQGATELHADGTFKVVPSTPHCRQLFILHMIVQNHVRYNYYFPVIKIFNKNNNLLSLF